MNDDLESKTMLKGFLIVKPAGFGTTVRPFETAKRPKVVLAIENSTKILVSYKDHNININIQDNYSHDLILTNDDPNIVLEWVLKLRGQLFDDDLLSITDFNIKTVIGRGFYGKIMLVQSKATGELYAIKTVHKSRLTKSNKIHTIINERNILIKARHPFIVSLCFAFQTTSKFYLGLEYVPGGDLFRLLDSEMSYSQKLLYLAEIGLAISFLHQIGVLYRDLKPENILIGSDGHIKLTDFGLSKEIMDFEFANTFCGTAQYVAPEVVSRNNYDFAADWWSYGIITYELLYGDVPYYSENRNEMFDMILYQKIGFPEIAQQSEIEFINAFLVKNPKRRASFDQMKNHSFWKNLNMDKVIRKEVKPDYVPKVINWETSDFFDESFTHEAALDSPGTPGEVMLSGFSFTATDSKLSSLPNSPISGKIPTNFVDFPDPISPFSNLVPPSESDYPDSMVIDL